MVSFGHERQGDRINVVFDVFPEEEILRYFGETPAEEENGIEQKSATMIRFSKSRSFSSASNNNSPSGTNNGLAPLSSMKHTQMKAQCKRQAKPNPDCNIEPVLLTDQLSSIVPWFCSLYVICCNLLTCNSNLYVN